MKVVQIGCGKMSLYTMRYVLEKGGLLVGAFDISKDVIGKDVAEVLNMNGSICKVEDIAIEEFYEEEIEETDNEEVIIEEVKEEPKQETKYDYIAMLTIPKINLQRGFLIQN